MNDYEKSAIIGYWRSGASEEEIYHLSGISIPGIRLAIKERKLICGVREINDKIENGNKGRKVKLTKKRIPKELTNEYFDWKNFKAY